MKLLNKYCLLVLILSCLILISCNNQNPLNIVNDMKNGLENDFIKQLYAKDIKNVYKMTESKQIKIWYYETDLNGDGYKDIIAIVQSPLHSGSHGDLFDIWINNGNGEYNDVSGLTLPIISIYPEYNGQIYISNEKTNKFKNVNIILSDKQDINLIYQNGKYDFEEQHWNRGEGFSDYSNNLRTPTLLIIYHNLVSFVNTIVKHNPIQMG